MTIISGQAAIEVRVDWQQNGCAHSNVRHFGKFSFWRDILPGALSLKLPQTTGEWISESFTAGELTPAWSERNIHRVARSALKTQRSNGPSIELHRGRYYPGYIAAGTGELFAGNVQPVRLIELDDTHATLDLNHPLARYPLTVSARIVERLENCGENGGRCEDVLQEICTAGAGLEALLTDGSPDWFTPTGFARMDPRADALFYRDPRLVQHVDRRASDQINALYGRLLQPGMRVLDLMSSWVSHLPDTLELQVSGLGMNAEELAHNPRLSEQIVQDLNTQPGLPFADRHFDAAICTLSIEYLIDPLAVLRELARVLKPGAALVITFSDRWFPTKAIALWSELHPFERVALVEEYLRTAGGFEQLSTETRHGWPRPQDDPHADRLALSDPVFAVRGYTSQRGL